MGNYGIKITKPGEDITSTDEKDYIMWSKYPFMKTYMVGTTSHTFSGDDDTVTIEITHNLNYYPVVWLAIDGPSAEDHTLNWWAEWESSGGDKALRAWQTKVTYTKLKIYYSELLVEGSGYDPTDETWDFKYFIFIDEHLGGKT